MLDALSRLAADSTSLRFATLLLLERRPTLPVSAHRVSDHLPGQPWSGGLDPNRIEKLEQSTPNSGLCLTFFRVQNGNRVLFISSRIS